VEELVLDNESSQVIAKITDLHLSFIFPVQLFKYSKNHCVCIENGLWSFLPSS
jgi:hypothetical protein